MESGRGDRTLPPKMARKRHRGGGDVESSDDDAASVELGGEPACEEPRLLLFKLDPDMECEQFGEEWCVQAKSRAVQIRFGNEHTIRWWDGDRKRYPLERVRLKPDTGVHEFRIDASVCEVLRRFLTDATNYTEHGFLKMAGTTWPGYGGYPYVHAAQGLVAAAQEKRTTRVHGKVQVNLVLKKEPQVWALVAAVRRALGLPEPDKKVLQRAGKSILAFHILCQDVTQQASFSWHSDAEDLQGLGGADRSQMTTVIVNLSHGCSGMRLWGCAPVLYRAQGDAIAFPGSALHESLPRRELCESDCAVYKVALFFN